jgi:hypothetical protein
MKYICFYVLLGLTQEKHVGVKDISNKNSREKENTFYGQYIFSTSLTINEIMR